MADENRSLNRFIRRTLYSLKRQYGSRGDIYKLVSVDTDYETGVETVSKTVNIVRKCIVLPVKIAREISKTISQISSNKMFVYGGTYDAGTRMFIVDTRDLPTDFEFTNDDWIVYNSRRYDIKTIEEFEQRTAWTLVAREIAGVRPEQVLFAHVTDQLSMSQEVTS